MQCAVCQEEIPEGSGHFRIAEARVHLECLRAFWRISSPNVMQPSQVPPTPPAAPPYTP
jgi:hypothetical protein